MELSFSLNYLMTGSDGSKRLNISDAVKICRGAGFEYVDYSPDYMSEDWEDKAHRDKELLDKAGITVEQTHAPFNRYRKFSDDLFPVYYERLFKASKIVGAKYVVVHADEYRTKDRYVEKEIMDFTYDYLAPHVDFAAANGMTVAVENVFEDNSWRYAMIDGKSRFTSRVEEIEGIIERFNSPHVACCWDFGHAKCAYGNDKMADALSKVAKYVVCTHVHDNYYEKDLHLLPFIGDTDWQKNLSVLKSSGYSGKLSFELVYGNVPQMLIPAWLDYTYSTGKYLAGIFDKE